MKDDESLHDEIFAFHLSQCLFSKMTNDNCSILSKDSNFLASPF